VAQFANISAILGQFFVGICASSRSDHGLPYYQFSGFREKFFPTSQAGEVVQNPLPCIHNFSVLLGTQTTVQMAELFFLPHHAQVYGGAANLSFFVILF
jgi:hypothetical protein